MNAVPTTSTDGRSTTVHELLTLLVWLPMGVAVLVPPAGADAG